MTTTAPDTDALALVRDVCPLVHDLGGAWFFSDEVARAGARAGIDDRFALYASGRGGVLGDCDPAVVASAFAFFPAEIVTAKYRQGVAGRTPRDCARIYAAGLAAWGTRVFGDVPDVARLVRLARKVADAVHPMGLPLFTGWRAVPVPDDPAAATALALQVLRELRGDLHIHAVVAHELTPLQAILGEDGPGRAAELRYPGPYPPLGTFADRRQAAEDLTDRLVSPAYSVLDDAERRALGDLLRRAHEAARSRAQQEPPP